MLTGRAKAYFRVTRAIGIATTAPGLGGGAEDYVLMEGPEAEPSDDVLRTGKELFGELKTRLVDG